MFSIVSCRIFISSSHFYWFENGEGVDRSLCYTNKVNFIVLSSFIMKYALEGCYSVCVICVLRQNWNCSVNLTVYFFSSPASLSTASWRRHASLIVEKIWAWKEWHTLPIHYLIIEVQKIIVFVQNSYWMQLIIRSENYIFLTKKFPVVSNGFLIII